MPSKTALVTRATGTQGRGVVKHLLSSGWQVRALVSDPSNDRSKSVKELSEHVTLYKGTWTEPASIEAAMTGCQVLFLVQMPSFTDHSETKEAQVFLDVAKSAGIQHIVHSTTLPLESPKAREVYEKALTGPAVLAKGDVEEMVKASGIPWTILRPGYFMTNITPPLVYWQFPEMAEGKFVNSYGPDCQLPLIDPEDIGLFAAKAFDHPEAYAGKSVGLVGEVIRVDKALQMLQDAWGIPIEAVYRSEEQNEKEKDTSIFVAGQVGVRDMDSYVNWDKLKEWGIPMTSFAEFLEKHKSDFVSPDLQNAERFAKIDIPK